MFRPLPLYIGLRYFRAKRRNGFISFISFSSTIGIMLGVAVLIIGLSMMNGFEQQLKERLLAFIPHAELETTDKPIRSWQHLYAQARINKEVVAGAPYIKRSALIDLGSKLKAIQIKAILPEHESTVTKLADYVAPEDWGKLQAGSHEIILGVALKELGLKKGDSISLMLPNTNSRLKLRAPLRAQFTIAGFSEFGGAVGAATAYIHLHDAQTILDMGSSVTGVSLKVSELMSADRVVRAIGSHLSYLVYLKSWKSSQGFLYQDILMVKSIMYVILLLVVAVACFNIVSTLVMAVKDKRSDIAILKTMGASKRLIQSIFIVQGLINAFTGALLGLIFGVVIALTLPDMLKALEAYFNVELLSGDIYFINFIPSQLQYQDVVVVFCSAIFMGLVSTIYPAYAASKTQPARELGHG